MRGASQTHHICEPSTVPVRATGNNSQGQRPEQYKPASGPRGPRHTPGDPPHTSRSKRILSHSQSPTCHLCLVPAGAPTKKDTGTIMVWGAWKRPSGCPHSDNAPMPRRSVVPTRFSLSPPDPSHQLSQRCTGGLSQESPPDCLSSKAGVHPMGAPTHSPHPMSGTQPQTAGGNPIDRADAARALTEAELGPEALSFPSEPL